MSRSETFLSITAGVYLALVLVPLAALISVSAGATLPGLVGLVAAGLLVTLGGTAVAAGVDDLHARLASPLLGGTVVGAPLAFLSAFLSDGLSGTLAGLTVAGVGASAVGVMLLIVAAAVRSQHQLDAATEYVTVESEDDSRGWEDGVQLVGGLLGLVVFLATAGVALLHGGFDGALTTLVTGIGGIATTIGTLFDDDTTEVTVTDDGLAVNTFFYEADGLESYRVTDEKLVVERSGRWPKVTLDRDEFDDETFDRLVEHLDRIVDRAEGEADEGGLFERTTDDSDESFGDTVDNWLRGDDTETAPTADDRERAHAADDRERAHE